MSQYLEPTGKYIRLLSFEYLTLQAGPTNCNGALQYKYGPQGSTNSALISAASATFYLEGSQSYKFTVKAKNVKGFSQVVAKSGQSGTLGMSIQFLLVY